jgi:hypothetical protein
MEDPRQEDGDGERRLAKKIMEGVMPVPVLAMEMAMRATKTFDVRDSEDQSRFVLMSPRRLLSMASRFRQSETSIPTPSCMQNVDPMIDALGW